MTWPFLLILKGTYLIGTIILLLLSSLIICQAKNEEHVTVTATITPLPRNIPSNMPDSCLERRPSWRLRVENGSKVC